MILRIRPIRRAAHALRIRTEDRTNCQFDKFHVTRGRKSQDVSRGELTKSELAKVKRFEKSYTAAVNKLMSDPSAEAGISVPQILGGQSTGRTDSFTVSGGYVGSALISRTFTADFASKQGQALANTDSSSNTTTVYSTSLSGGGHVQLQHNGPLFGGDYSRQITVVHEGIHGTGNEARGLTDTLLLGYHPLDMDHQIPYNSAAATLLGP